MEYAQLIRFRESVRNYDPNMPVNRKIIDKILDAGRLAPSACNNQPWKFLVISSPEMRRKMEACYHQQWFRDAPHVLVALGLKNEAWVRKYDGYNSIETDLAIAMTHIILAAADEGVGTCWIAAFDPAALHEALSLSNNQVVFGITPLGYPRSDFKRKGMKTRKSLTDIIEFL